MAGRDAAGEEIDMQQVQNVEVFDRHGRQRIADGAVLAAGDVNRCFIKRDDAFVVEVADCLVAVPARRRKRDRCLTGDDAVVRLLETCPECESARVECE